jgi:hypothetical protein
MGPEASAPIDRETAVDRPDGDTEAVVTEDMIEATASDPTVQRSNGEDANQTVDFGDEAAPSTAAEDVVATSDPGEGKNSRVTDLEREMARLLGEITSRRPS